MNRYTYIYVCLPGGESNRGRLFFGEDTRRFHVDAQVPRQLLKRSPKPVSKNFFKNWILLLEVSFTVSAQMSMHSVLCTPRKRPTKNPQLQTINTFCCSCSRVVARNWHALFHWGSTGTKCLGLLLGLGLGQSSVCSSESCALFLYDKNHCATRIQFKKLVKGFYGQIRGTDTRERRMASFRRTTHICC